MRKLLIPFSILFRIIVFIRNILYRFNFFKTVKLSTKIISVGNISTGGTGKTPMVEYLARLIIEKNKFVAILTGGYKRMKDDIRVIELGFKDTKHELTINDLGDESLMILDDFCDTEPGKGLLVVSGNKTSGAKLVSSKFKPDVIIIDDGFQHRKLQRDLDIVMIDKNTKGFLLPAGNLREPKSSLSRANIIIYNQKLDRSNRQVQKKKRYRELNCVYEFDTILNIKNEPLILDNTEAVAFCAIGDPSSFKDLMNQLNIPVKEFIQYPDHHELSGQEAAKIIELFRSSQSQYILTTHKDFVRLKYSPEVLNSVNNRTNPLWDLLFNYPLYYAKIKLQISGNLEVLKNNLETFIT